ncbi:MAG: hypothetical protein M0Q13_06385 [Methanothrix sp.]|jgi:trans-aconitate methyltransferase|nr:hypothetical protein [Methanothrix sp.]
MPRERNSVIIDLAITTNDNVKDYIVRMLRKKINDMEFEHEYYDTELKIAEDQKKVNLSNGRKYYDLYKEKLEKLDLEMKAFNDSIDIVNKTNFPIIK